MSTKLCYKKRPSGCKIWAPMLISLGLSPFVAMPVSAGLIGPPFGGGVPLPGTSLQFAWEVVWEPDTNFYHYTYALTNNSSEIIEDVRVTIAEDRFDHKGVHDEFGVFGPFERDVPAPGIRDHNYDWSALDVLPGVGVPPGASVFFGFHDTHGPGLEPWRIQVDDLVILNEDDDCGLLAPVPRIGGTGAGISTDGRCGDLFELNGIAAPPGMGGGVAIPGFFEGAEKAVQLDGAAVQIDGDSVEYLYFLRNTGTEIIGPEILGEFENHFDFFVNENTQHFDEHGHDFDFLTFEDNVFASTVGNDSTGHDGIPVPVGIDDIHNFFWHGVGDGRAWQPGDVLTVGFVDTGGHGPVVSQSGFALLGFNEFAGGLFSSPVPVPGPFTRLQISENFTISRIDEPPVLLLVVLPLIGYFSMRRRIEARTAKST